MTIPNPTYWEPAICDELGNTPFPFLVRAHWTKGHSYLVVDEPLGQAGSLLLPRTVRASNDTVPRQLQPEEIVDKVRNNTTARR